ncbi:heteromeric transposase endonuclease subunit TnsA [uncultured Pseudodesulfovibrio sp.]|uniref:heteromeric transposase endonuclease subunit TnsA n=1 Tax=uncultured Pseudodesulfovibrio sp. TaxID=2035858 RepID=UPI0029C84646|nr:heteromeric transposase endonuclease subunit TnsA [uncultured Pseudodesulfovibrio sp.]
MYYNKCDKKPRQVRKIKSTRRSISGSYVFRGESAIQFESSLERDFLIRLEFNLAVLDVIPQPCEIPFTDGNGQSRTYTPDFLVYYKMGNSCYANHIRPQLIEVKPEAHWRANRRKWLLKWKAAYRYAKEKGWFFHIHDESRIRDQVYKNIRFLERYKQMSFAPEESEWVTKNIQTKGAISIDRILARHFMGNYRSEGLSHIWYLLATRKLDCDMSLPLNEQTELWVPTND